MGQTIQEKATGLRQILARGSNRMLDLFLPPQCLLTGETVQHHGALSPKAWHSLNFIAPPYCAHCGRPFQIDQGDDMLCGSCAAPDGFGLIDPKGLDSVRAALAYDDMSSQLILKLKYADRQDGAGALATLLMSALDGLNVAPTAILVPVPLHHTRLRQRRFNQSAILAKALAQKTQLTNMVDLLARVKATPPQQGLSAIARHRNVQGAFKARFPEKIKNQHIILVDDVLTTGSTLKACAKVLKKAGADKVSAVVLARTIDQPIGALRRKEQSS